METTMETKNNSLSEREIETIKDIKISDIPTLSPLLKGFVYNYIEANMAGFIKVEDYIKIYLKTLDTSSSISSKRGDYHG